MPIIKTRKTDVFAEFRLNHILQIAENRNIFSQIEIKRPSFYRRHRNAVNIGIATGGGALLGGLMGGRKGAGLGALIGLGSGALYTYKLNKKKRRY